VPGAAGSVKDPPTTSTSSPTQHDLPDPCIGRSRTAGTKGELSTTVEVGAAARRTVTENVNEMIRTPARHHARDAEQGLAQDQLARFRELLGPPPKAEGHQRRSQIDMWSAPW